MQTFDLFTIHYAKYDPDMGTAVRFSNGYPRFFKHDLRFELKEGFPYWADVKSGMPQDEFKARYHAKLARAGVEQLASRMRAIAVASGDPRLVLMCYENIMKPPVGSNWCHRTMFGEWYTSMTGDPVRELGPVPNVAPIVEEDTLW